jgi:hypothetical protein
MENDAIRASGSDTLVDMWIEGKVRGICVSQDAIGAFLGFDRVASMSDRDRCDFVRTHLPLVVTAAKARIDKEPEAETVTIELGELPRADGGGGDRRKDDRRVVQRRKVARPIGAKPDRRRADRRTRERRRSPRTKDS